MDAEIDTTDNGCGNEEDVEVELFFRKPPEINNFELVKTFWIDPTEVINSTNDLAQEDQNNKPSSDPEVKVLQPLALRPLETAEDESGGSSCSHSEDVRLPDEILDEPLDDEVFEEEEEKTENVETGLVFRQPTEKEMELVYTISKSAVFNLDDLEEEDEDVEVDLWFREPTDTRFELVYTIPLMEDVSVDSLGETLEDLPPAEELDNVVEEASVAEFTFKPIENDEETETVTTEVVTVLERGGEGSRDFIEKVKLTSNDTFDNFDDEGEDAFQNAFVKSVETPETPVPEYDENQEDIIQDVSVSDVLKDAAEKLQIIQDSENTGTLKQTASAPEFVSDIRTPEGSPDETETTRFEISSVDEKDITLPDTDNVPFLEVTQETDRVPSQEPSDYAQLESISSPDDVPDVDRTLNSLKNEDVFPKEAIPNEVPKIEVTPEAETLPVVGLEDSGMVETPKVAGLSKEDVAEALNAEDVITGDDGVLAATPDVLSVDNHAKDDDPVIEDSGEVETTEVIELKQDVIEAALNSEDVLTDSHVMPQNETTQGDQPVEESGAIESPSVVDLNSEVVTDALNSEDVNSQTELPDGSNPDNTTSEEKPQPVLKLEDSGIVETPDLVELDKEDVVDALNSEDVLTEADVVQISTEIHDNETPIEDQLVADLEDSGPTEVVAGALNSEDVQKEDDTTSVLDEPVLKLEDSGIVETSEVVALDHQDALNSQEDECAVVSSEVTETSEATHEAETINGSNGDETPVDDSMIGLEEGGDVETANAVELSNEIAADALNSEDVTGVTSLPVVDSEVHEAEQEIEETSEENIQPVVKLEDSGVAETPDIVELDREVVEDALNSEDVQKEDNTTPVLDEPVLKFEDSGIVETSEVVALDHQDVKDALNSEYALLETEGAVVSSQVTETLEATHEADTIDGLNGKENPVDDSMIWQENQPVIGLEDGGDVETANAVELSNEIAADALNSEDVTGVTSLPVVDSEVHEAEQEIEETSEENIQPVVKLEDSGVAETPDIVELDGKVVEDALNSEDVVNETTAVAEASESHEATQEESSETELHQEKTAAVLGLEESGEVEPLNVVALSNQEAADAMNGEDVVKVAEEVAGEEAEQVYSELPPEVEESVVDSQSEEEEQVFIKNQEDQEKESTPVAGTEELATEIEETLVEKLVSMVEDTLPVDYVAISDEISDETPEEPKETKPKTSEPESETMIDADNERKDLDNVLDSSEDQSKPEEAEPAPEKTMVQKLVSMVENVLPAEAVLPSEDVVSEEHIEEREDDKKSAETSENPTIMEKLVSIVENIVPVETQDESLSPAVEEQEAKRVEKDSEETETLEDTQPEETFVEMVVSIVENDLPVDAVLPSEDVLSEDHVEDPVIELSSENAEDSTILEKLTSVVGSALPSKDNKNIDEEKEAEENEETATMSATENSELPAEPTIMEKLTSMVESAIPSKDSVPAEPVVVENEINEVTVEPTLMQQLTSIVESVLPTQEPVKNTEEPANPTELVEDTTPEVSAAPEPTLMEKLTSMVESVLPSKDEVSEENHVETSVEVSETNDAVTEPTILEKLASMVENVLPADAILLSDYVRQSEERNSEARPEELDPSDQVPLVQIEHLEEVSATQDSAVTTEAEEVLEPEEENVSGEIVPSFEDTTSDDRAGQFEKPIEDVADADKRDDLDRVLDSSEDPSKPEEVETAPEETMVQKLVSMVENVLPAETVLPSEDVVSEEHIKEREEDEQPAETSENPTILEKLVSMVENIVPVETSLETHDESLSSIVEKQESNQIEKDSEETTTPEATQLEEIIPVSADTSPQEEPDDTQRHLNEENQNESTVETIISTSDIILPFEENTSLETPFDAEGFTEPPVEKEKQESFKEPTAEDIIETADIILPVEEKESKNIETPFDAEGFVSEDPVETPVKNEIQQEDVTDETQPEKSTVVEELLAMAVDILPIDGTVAEKIEEESLVEKTTVEAFETPNEDPGEFRESGTSDPELPGEAEYVPEESQPLPRKVRENGEQKMTPWKNENAIEVNNEPQETINPTIQVVEVTVQSDDNHPEDVPTSSQDTEEHLTKTDQHQEPHKITDVHFDIPKHHDDYGNDYVPFGTEPSARVEFNNPEESKEEEEDFVAELNFHPIRQWKDEDVISLQSLKSLVAEVGCTTDVSVEPHQQAPEDNESTLKILKVVPSEPSLMELDISNDPSVIHVPIPLLEPATKYLEEMVKWIIADAVKEVGEMEVVTESEISEMVAQESENECPVPEPLADLKLPTEDDEKTPEPETPIEVARVIPVEVEPVQSIPQRPPRAPKVEGSKLDTSKSLDQHNKSKVRFRPLNIKLGRSYSEEQQKELVEMLERPLTVITSSEQKPSEPKPSPLSPNTLDEYEHVPMMDMQSVPHSPQEKLEEVVEENEEQKEPEDLPMVEQIEQPVGFVKKVEVKTVETPEDVHIPQTKIFITETRILGAGKSAEYVDDEDGSECLDSIGDLSERTIQRFNTSSEQQCALLWFSFES
ncbi:CRE-RET-1 protein [Caenorhabditis remanei]|uniref:CRE-RET-1 protein n=1 Tax=Caenorhabditis remanei TaxID=31234 RepID=E3MN83_CAERE|nr:CRE-RET-1 protein [Caenorhabditis remanei]